ncbi:uncharacterized protein [Anabrus simplex]|uniref:uncharacterized protein n=1 Tax=Anabrus simplex TaxID=316456 RepID=UPI0034DD70CF
MLRVRMDLMDLPEPEMYTEVDSNTILPPFTKKHLNEFLHRFGKKGDIGKQMYSRKFLIHASVAYVGVDVYLKGKCKDTKMQYTTNIKIGEEGDVEESSCECSIQDGNTASCNHVIGLLFAAEEIVQESTIKLHKGQRHQEKIINNTCFRTKRTITKRDGIVFNPIPRRYRKLPHYNDWVRNLCTTFGPSTMPIKQLFAPAEVDSFKWDHSYGKSDNGC